MAHLIYIRELSELRNVRSIVEISGFFPIKHFSVKMERFMHVNSLANGSNRLLFRFPIYRNFGFGDKNINTMKSYNSGKWVVLKYSGSI